MVVGPPRSSFAVGAVALVVAVAVGLGLAVFWPKGTGDTVPPPAPSAGKTNQAKPAPVRTDAGATPDKEPVDSEPAAKPSSATKPKPSKVVAKGSPAPAQQKAPAAETPPAADSRECTLIVRTTPEGAVVKLQGSKIGESPVTQKGLSCTRSYRLNVSASGYRSRTLNFEFKHNKVLVRNVPLARRIVKKEAVPTPGPVSSDPPVKLMIGTPGIRAQVRVDGKSVGPTPVVARAPLLTPGRHVLDLMVDGRTYSYTVNVPKANKAQRLIIRKLGQPVGGPVKAIPR